MKLFHISDLHIGKQLKGYNLCEDQEYILAQIVTAAEEKKPDAILIAGDIFDRTIPSGEAYTVWNHFLVSLSKACPAASICMIAGNHDSPERLAYGKEFLKEHHIFVSTMPPKTEEEHLVCVRLEDAEGPVNIYLLPFTKPGYIRTLFPELEQSYEEAIRLLLERERVNLDERNVLVAHQLVIGMREDTGEQIEPEYSDSEQFALQIGGTDRIDGSILKAFDYVALGHIHKPQQIGGNRIQYSGSILKYSSSEAKHEKGILMITMGKKGEEPIVERIPLIPKRDMHILKGTLQELIKMSETYGKDYASLIVTDQEELYEPRKVLEQQYPYLIDFHMEYYEKAAQYELHDTESWDKTPEALFGEFYEEMLQCSLTEEQKKLIEEILCEIE